MGPTSPSGFGAPQAVGDRLARLSAAQPLGWAGPPSSVLALEQVGFEFVGEVMGGIAAVLTDYYHGQCGYRRGQAPPVRLASTSSVWGRRGATTFPYRAERMYAAALERLRSEVRARGADGAVAVGHTTTRLDGDLHEVTLTGLAVRAKPTRSVRVRPERGFLTSLEPVDTAALLGSGWVPVDLHVAVECALRHDAEMRELADEMRMGSLRRTNFEIAGFTETVNGARGAVRDRLRSRAAKAGADGVTIHDFAVDSRHCHCVGTQGGTDRIVQVTGWAASMARFRSDTRSPVTPPLVIMPLTRRSDPDA